MSDDDRNPVGPLIAGLLIGLPILYVAMFGPAVSLHNWLDNSPDWLVWYLRSPDPIEWLIKALLGLESSRWEMRYFEYYDWWARLGLSFR